MAGRAVRTAAAAVTADVLLSLAALLSVTPAAVAAVPPPDPPAPGPASTPIPIGPDPASSTASDKLTWGVTPSLAGGAADRTAFTYQVEPGRRIPDTVRITNFAGTPLDLQIYAQDGITTRDGGFDLLSGDQAANDVGAWVRIRARSVMIPARSRIDVPFVVEVPADARPGDHSGGIVAAVLDRRRSTDGQLVQFEERVGARIYLRVPGEITAALTVEDLRVEYRTPRNPLTPGLARLTYTVRNAGNVRLGAQPTARVRDLAGLHVRAAPGPPVSQILPGQVVTVVQELPGVWPLVRLRATAAADPLAPPEAATVEVPPIRPASRDFWAVPWPALALLAAIAAAWVARRRRQSRLDASPAAPGTDRTSELTDPKSQEASR